MLVEHAPIPVSVIISLTPVELDPSNLRFLRIGNVLSPLWFRIFHILITNLRLGRVLKDINELDQVRHPNRSPSFQCFSDWGVALF